MSDSTLVAGVADGSSNSAVPAEVTRQLTFSRRVTGREVLLALLGVVLVPALAGVLVVVVGAVFKQDWLIGLVVPVGTVVGIAGIWVALIRRGWSGRDLGFVRASRSLWHLCWEVPLTWVVALTLTVVAGTLAGVEPSGTGSSTSGSADVLGLGVGAVLITALCAAVVFPVLEEVLFRRVLFGWLEQRFSVKVAIAGSALLFGLMHVVPAVVLLAFLLGLGAGILVRVHRTLWASLGLHTFNNAIVTVATLIVVL